MPRTSRAALCTGALAVVAVVAGCTSTAPPATQAGGGGAPAGGPITVAATDTACQVSAAEAPAGNITFAVNNAGTKVTEFYLYGTGDRIMGEMENIGPGLTRQLIVEVPDGGTYTTACKPGMVGDGIRTTITVKPHADHGTHDGAQ
jgi:iron uptake system component EfeO